MMGLPKPLKPIIEIKVKTAAEKGEPIPKLSNIYEEIIEKGWEKSNVKKK